MMNRSQHISSLGRLIVGWGEVAKAASGKLCWAQAWQYYCVDGLVERVLDAIRPCTLESLTEYHRQDQKL